MTTDTKTTRIVLPGDTAGSARVRRSGVAMTETVLILPLIFLVLALIYFFGLSMTRLQRASVTDRYEAWRQSVYAAGPGAEFDKEGDFGRADLLNEAFYASDADAVDVQDRSGRVTADGPTDLIADQVLMEVAPLESPRYDPQVAADLVRTQALYGPAWWRVGLSTEYLWDAPIYQRYEGPIRHQSTRIDGDWSFASWIEQEYRGDRQRLGEVLVNDVFFTGDDQQNDGDIYPDLDSLTPASVSGVCHTFYESFDPVFMQMDDIDGNPLARSIRLIYLSYGGYEGPQLLPVKRGYYRWYRPRAEPPEGESLD